jgi:hypothetical protein
MDEPAPSKTIEEAIGDLRAGAVEALATFGSSSPLARRRNGDTPIGNSRRAALRREQCDIMTEENSHCLETAR